MPRSRTDRLSAPQARRIALAAQGFADPAPAGRVDRRHIRRVFDRVSLVQLDSVNVLVRSQYLPFLSRLGPYPRALLDDMAYRSREVFEYWGHEASLLPVALQPLFRWRMDGANAWGGMRRVARDHPEYVDAVLREVAGRGPISAGELPEPGERHDSMWGWSVGKRAMEWLFWTGRLAAIRRPTFERVYDLPERILPAAVLASPDPSLEEAHRRLLLLAARSMGVASARDLADYFRLTVPAVRPRLAELVESGSLLPVAVEGWKQPAFLHPDAVAPRRIQRRALLSPFDSLIWERARTERLFDFHYRIEIYTPAPKRRFGYYVLPFLMGDRLVARVDLKSDRTASALLVRSAHGEPGVEPGAVAVALAEELRSMATWLGLERVSVGGAGDLAASLRRALGVPFDK